ncbi:hypothetical protein Poly59_31340 [Rubripirellula reticaptiva]|uniref:Uncharacterized protein n=2 Tax=Rubripirellula reticaptiva TaxID=2528013 RepID=A0A5C6ER74_9BACT|nr:hypothetical protein Poly59_31340 [Rubripirellula reticaptiva]
MGAGLGAISFSAAIAMIPSSMDSTHSLKWRLATNLFLIYPALLGLWVGWIRRSKTWAVLGVVSGIAAGSVFIALYGTIVSVLPLRLVQVVVVVPCVLGGAMSALLGTKTESWISGVPQRFVRGVIAGFALGFTYGIIFSQVFPMSLPEYPYFKFTPYPPTEPENSPVSAAWFFRLWISGTLALTISSALFLTVYHWSAGLSSARSVGCEPSVATPAS